MQTTIIHLNKRVYCITIISLMSIIFYSIHIRPKNYIINEAFVEPLEVKPEPVENRPKQEELKYILLWTNPRNTPFSYFGEGRKVFLNKKCAFNNCYVTGDRGYLGDYTEFEVIAFNGPQINTLRYTNDLPKRRNTRQKYVYANIEASETYPICSKFWNNYFNWTWTYRLDSSSVWEYFTIRDSSNRIIGPNMAMHWMKIDEMDPIDLDFQKKLSTKTKAAAWFVSNCESRSLREDFVKQITAHLRDFNLDVDIYGDCGTLQCPKSIMSRCLKMIETRYFFYFAFENSISEDYVTEKVLYALNHNAVPIVFGGANYTRFMPNGTFLDARELSPKKLAETMFRLIHHPAEYHKFFRWKKHYRYHYTHEKPDSDVYCKFCEVLNNKELMETKTVYERLDLWWTPQHLCNDVITIKLN